MARYRVTSNAATGFDGVFRGYPPGPEMDPKTLKHNYEAGFGWHWPSKGIVIEVVDGQFDPPKDYQLPAGVERAIGQLTWQALQDDPRIFAGPVNPIDGDAVSAALAEANAKIAALEAQLAAASPASPAAPAETETKGGKKK